MVVVVFIFRLLQQEEEEEEEEEDIVEIVGVGVAILMSLFSCSNFGL